MQKGMHLAHLETARALLLKGIPLTTIAEVTQLSLEEVRAESEKIQQKSY